MRTPLLTGRKNVPRIVTEPVPAWVDPTVDPLIPSTDPVYAIGTLEEKDVKAFIPISNDALRYGEGVDPMVTSDTEKAIGAALDFAYLVGTANGPSGILKAENELVTTGTWEADAAKLVATVADAGLDTSEGVFFVGTATAIASVAAADALPRPGKTGPLYALGFPVVGIPGLNASPVMAFVVMDAVVVGDGHTSVALDSDTDLQTDVSNLRVVVGTDIKRRHKFAAAWATVAY